jgi:hypothetical protein
MDKQPVKSTDSKQAPTAAKPANHFQAVGRRREAVARVRLFKGQGQLTVNGKPISQYFQGLVAQKLYQQPFELTKTLGELSGSVKVLVLNHQASDPGIINTVVPISDFKISPKAGILVYGSVVDEYDGWAKVSVNGTDYPVAGPGSSVVVNGVTISPCTSCQNHDTAQLFHITVPTLPVSDGSDVTLKLYKSDTSKPPFIVPQTFKYYSNPTIPASDPYILPEANPNQSYNQPLISKIGSGNVNWIPHVIAGVIPRGFDVNNTSITYDPTNVYVKPNIGDIGMFIM